MRGMRATIGCGLLLFLVGSGTEAGVYLVRDLEQQSVGSLPRTFIASPSYVYFASAKHAVFGEEFWRTDGTEQGTILLKDINPGIGDTRPLFPVVFGSEVFFVAKGPGSPVGGVGQQIWRTDGTREGTELAVDFAEMESEGYPSELTAFGDHFYFAADAFGMGDELWRSDGTPEGTEMVKDIYAGPGNSFPQKLIATNDALYFVADDGVHGRELWRSDGTEAGTVLVADRAPGEAGSGFNTVLPAGDQVVFYANTDAGYQVSLSDGTESGTFALISGVLPEVTDTGAPLFAHEGLVYFSALGSTGWELWRTDGTVAGTVQLKRWGGLRTSTAMSI